jgi:hypothetical protein
MVLYNHNEMSMEEEKMMEHQLSASAKPFHPYTFGDPVNSMIYNDGVPSMVMGSKDGMSQILHGIQDEALDEEFPPDAQEAAELEAVEIFVEMMAQLSLLEEMEERSRVDFHHIKKRWESRRQEGLKTRPHAPRNLVDRNEHKAGVMGSFGTNCRSLVPHSHHRHREQTMMMMMQHDAARRVGKGKTPSAGTTTNRVVIQQPRKQS